MIDTQRVCCAKIKFIGSTKCYWQSVLHDINYLSQDPIILWEEVKLRLTKKYLVANHRNHLLDQLLNLRQGTSSITKYMANLRNQCYVVAFTRTIESLLLGL